MSETDTFVAGQPLLVTLLVERGVLKQEDLAEVQKAMAQQNQSVEEALGNSNQP